MAPAAQGGRAPRGLAGQLKQHRIALSAIGCMNVDQLAALERACGPAIQRHLGLSSRSELQALLEGAKQPSKQVLGQRMPIELPTGIRLTAIPRETKAHSIIPTAAFTKTPLAAAFNRSLVGPEQIDLRDTLVDSVGDQGPYRQTCVAFAALAVFHQYMKQAGGTPNLLSEQYLYWACKQQDGYPQDPGSLLRVAFSVLESSGCCLRETWGYQEDPIAGNEGGGPPPAEASAEASQYRAPQAHSISARSVPDVRAVLSAGSCVAVTIPAFPSWLRNDRVRESGDIVLPPTTDDSPDSHSFCLVGYVDDENAVGMGGGRFILRNSWNSRWGVRSPFGKGFGTLPYAFLDRYGVEAFALSGG